MAISIDLRKGHRVDVGLQKFGVGLGWDTNSDPSGPPFDLDLSAFMLGSNGRIPEVDFFVFYLSGNRNPPGSVYPNGTPISPDGAIELSKDVTAGEEEGDDESLKADLSRIDPRIEQIVFTATIYDSDERRQNFGQVRNSYIRIYDSLTGEELCKYELDEDFSVETAVEFGRLYKRNDGWRFEALGTAITGGLQGFVDKYT